jgi:RNA-directed DNA polymerase
VGKYHTGTNSRGTPLGFKTLIKPSKRKVQLHLHRLAELIRHGGNLTQEDLIRRLNPIIRGWSNYYRTVVSAQTFGHCDHQLYQSDTSRCKAVEVLMTATGVTGQDAWDATLG